MKIKTKILYSKAEREGKEYNIYIYALVDVKTGKGKKITFKDYENRRQQNKYEQIKTTLRSDIF